ncbi:MAG: type II toxin-antitoxin system HicA family toxin [Magnetococcales bacterium]|nr:type II toxin-antitoxin system HicA family toxin [Magnetococcales bacterium]
MGRVPPLAARDMASLLRAWGFELVRQRGSHQQWRHADGRQTTIPVHPGQDVSPILVRQIARDIALDVAVFLIRLAKSHNNGS